MAKILDKQNIFDIVLQETGGLNNVVRVLKDNGLDLTNSTVPGTELDINVIESKKIVNRFKLLNFNPNNNELSESQVLGIWILDTGFWNDLGRWIDSKIWID